MLYSPILSFFKLIVLVIWTIKISFLQALALIISDKYFFVFYKLLFLGLTKIFGIKVKKVGKLKNKKVLFVSNHISYLDILVLGSEVKGICVAKSEMRDWPLINKLCLLGKTIFVERFNPRSVKRQMKSIEDSMEKGFNVILFPEGTSSDGSKVLDFKSSLFKIIDSQKLASYQIQPISISYNKLDGVPLDKSFRPFLAWFGSMNLASHAWQLMGLGETEVNIHFHDAKPFKFFRDRKHASVYCHDVILNQVVNNYRSLEIDDKIKLNEFKFL